MGLPISWWGMIAYSVLAAVAAFGLFRRGLRPVFARGLVFFASLTAVGVSIVLAYIAHAIIDSLCLFCITLYLVNTILLGSGIAGLIAIRRNPFGALISDIVLLWKSPLVLAILVGVAVVPAGAAIAFLPAYWQHLGWNDIPQMPTGKDSRGAHWVGGTDPVLTIYEYSDYQCPYCRHAHKNTRAMIAEFGGKVRIVHKHFPVDNACNRAVKTIFHERACEFAMAVECAGQQEKFWEMNDALFALQDMVKPVDVNLDELVVSIGLDKPKYDTCMAGDGAMKQIQADIDEAIKRDLKGTPTYFIGAQPYPGGFSRRILRNAVDSIEKQKNK
jgi:protein-disulfide isomerase